jgi:translation initiation factor IF-2
VESISHARVAGVPIIVAVNKCDKPGVKPEVIRQRLMEHELIAEEFGGDVQMVNVSALKAEGIDELLEAVLLQAEILELRANPERSAEGVILEARVETGRGTVATLLVSTGTVETGQSYVVGTTSGRVRAMSNSRGERIESAGPSTPVELIGLSGVPEAGDSFVVVKDDRAARALAEHRAAQTRTRQGGTIKLTLEEIFARSQADELITLNLIVKADVQGSLEALCHALQRLEVPTTQVRVLHKGIGQVSESDVQLARGNEGIIIGFHVTADGKARALATQSGVDIRIYDVIYEALEEVQNALVGMLALVKEEVAEGQAEVRELFRVPRLGVIAGCFVHQGRVVRNGSARLLRTGKLIWEGQIGSLKRFKDDVREVQNNFECGIGLDGCEMVEVGDVIECYTVQEVAPTLEDLRGSA